jgi:aldehyde dehydrogenase (NAD+)
MGHKHARLEYLPLGVVAAIVSWNYPFHNTYGPIISALFAGNAIVIKVCGQAGINDTAAVMHGLCPKWGFLPWLGRVVLRYRDDLWLVDPIH